MNGNAVEAIELTKKFGSFISVDCISFSVRRGSIFGFLGANGAGKSTTIRMLCGIIAPTAGDAFVNGYSVTRDADKVKLSIGYMSQKFSLYNDLTVIENIEFFGGIYGLEQERLTDRTKWVLETANLKGRENTLAGILPGGIKQRLALGVAVMHHPGILFLDEPTSGVDPISRRTFWDLIRFLSAEGTTVFITTHYLEEAEYCDNLTFINAGKIAAEGTSSELKSKFILAPMYEIESDKPVALLDFLLKQEFTQEASLFGVNIHLLVKEADMSPAKIRSLTEKQSACEIRRIEPIVPTLEDVFIKLLGEEGKRK